MTSTARQYHATTLEGATHLGLLLAAYDVLAEDIRLAGEAAEHKNIEERCRLSEHANLLLGHLESWTPLLQDPVLEASLISFYNLLRAELLRLQQTCDRRSFEELAITICVMRAVWHQKGSIVHASDQCDVHASGMPLTDQPENTSARHVWSA